MVGALWNFLAIVVMKVAGYTSCELVPISVVGSYTIGTNILNVKFSVVDVLHQS